MLEIEDLDYLGRKPFDLKGIKNRTFALLCSFGHRAFEGGTGMVGRDGMERDFKVRALAIGPGQ